MATLRELRNFVKDRIEEDRTTVIDRYINIALDTVSKHQEWDALRRTKSVTVSSGTIISPVLARKITGVFSTDDPPRLFHPATRTPTAGQIYQVGYRLFHEVFLPEKKKHGGALSLLNPFVQSGKLFLSQ